VYSVESEHHALEQVAALPAEALPYYAELMTVLETAPWGGLLGTVQLSWTRAAPGRLPGTARPW